MRDFLWRDKRNFLCETRTTAIFLAQVQLVARLHMTVCDKQLCHKYDFLWQRYDNEQLTLPRWLHGLSGVRQ